MLLALKIDVDTLRGTREGVPRLTEILRRHDASATFFFSMGPDHTGRAIRRATRPGYVARVRRSGVLSHYGMGAMLYGTVLPGPDIGRRAAAEMRAVRDAGFETGIHCHDHVRWHDGVATADAEWTEAEMQRAIDRYAQVFGEPPRAHAAAGWQMNRHAFRLTQRLGFDYASDGRGRGPHLPVWNAELVRCPQLPTTLPTLAELLALDAHGHDNVGARLLERTADAGASHVYTVQAELEGMGLSPVFEQLLLGWKAQGYQLVPLRALYESVEPMALPRCEVGWGEVPGCSGSLIVQGDEFLGAVDLAQAA